VTPTPTRDTPAGQSYNSLRNLARKHQRDFAEYLTLYALEGLLARLASSTQATDLVLKGGVLMAAFAARRPTRDIDLRASGLANDVAACEQLIRAIATIELGDGLHFDPSAVRGETIRDEDLYPGVRVRMDASLANARIAIHVDLSFGDPISPAAEPIDLPRLLGGSVRLLGYPDHMVLAEKIVTAIQRGIANTRWRDFVDVDAISSYRVIAGADLTRSLATVAAHRQATLRPLDQVLAGMAQSAQPKWLAWRRKQRLETSTPQHFQDLIKRYVAFADPILTGEATGLMWNPESASWT